MKKLFYLGLLGLACFEVANVYFIMPMPGSQRMRSIDTAYFLYTWRWAFRDELGGTPVVIVLAADGASFFAYERPDAATRFTLRDDSLVAPGAAYALSGRGAPGALTRVSAYQEFWHSWRTFHPGTKTY
jgi:hypothetical protein